MVKPAIFISYKRGHEPSLKAVEQIERRLREGGFEILIDKKIEPGSAWNQDLYTWLMECSAAIALIGDEAAKSEWCRREWWYLRERNRKQGMPLFPVRVDGSGSSGKILDDIQSLALTEDLLRGFVQKLSGLEAARPSARSYLDAHHAFLRWRFRDERVWGREPFSLSEVYVDTECGRLTWSEIAQSSEPRDPFRDSEETGGRHDLVASVVELIFNHDYREPIVVQGPPGCGKSAFTLRLANELLDRGFKPILVRFRDFRLANAASVEELIDDALRIGPVEDQPPGPEERVVNRDALDRSLTVGKSKCSELVFILDGWDEVSLTGNASYRAQLDTWLPKIREFIVGRPGPPVRLILTGRPSVALKDSGILRRNTQILTVRHMRPEALRSFANAVAERVNHARSEGRDDDWQLDMTRLEPIFKNYAAWFKSKKTPGNTNSSMDVLGSPLLTLLTFRTLAGWEGDASKLINEPTALYKALMDVTVEHAGKGLDEGVHGIHRGGEQLRHLLHAVAKAISTFGREAISFVELQHRLQEDAAYFAWAGGKDLRVAVEEASVHSTLHELVVNFYFKGGHTGVGCEFLHKSFREYLFAEAIVTCLKTIAGDKSGPLKETSAKSWEEFNPRSPQYEAAHALAFMLSPQWLTLEVRGHLFWLLRTDIAASPQQWVWLRDLLLDVYAWWAEGVHLRPQPKTERGRLKWETPFVQELLEHALPYDAATPAERMRSTELDAHLGEALMQMTALVHEALLDQPWRDDLSDGIRKRYRRQTDKSFRFAPGGQSHFRALCARINAAGWRPEEFPAGVYLTAVDLSDDNLNGLICAGVNLADARLTSTQMVQTDLQKAKLSGSDLRRAALHEANLGFANLNQANLTEAEFYHASLIEAHLIDATLIGADFNRALLFRTKLTGAKIRNAKFSDAILSEASMRREDAMAASLTEAQRKTMKLS